jgi:hypothetical protein
MFNGVRLLLSTHFWSSNISIGNRLKHVLVLRYSTLEDVFSPRCVENRKILCPGRLLERLVAYARKGLNEIVIILVVVIRLIFINLVIEIHSLPFAATSPLVVVVLALLEVIVVLVQLVLLNRPEVKLSLAFSFLIQGGCSDGHLVVPLSLLLLMLMRVGESILVFPVVPPLLLLATPDLIYQYIQH